MIRIFFTITNKHGSHPISYGLYWLVVTQCNKDRFLAHRLFWDARAKQDPIAYIRKKISKKWHRIDTVDMDYNKAEMEAWIQQTIFKKKKTPRQAVTIKKESTIDSIGTLLAGIVKKG
jgi:hypothetical protein